MSLVLICITLDIFNVVIKKTGLGSLVYQPDTNDSLIAVTKYIELTGAALRAKRSCVFGGAMHQCCEANWGESSTSQETEIDTF
jgi:hypothetical protein